MKRILCVLLLFNVIYTNNSIAQIEIFDTINQVRVNPYELHEKYKNQLVENGMIDYPKFQELTRTVYAYRNDRLIGLDTFFEYACDPNTIILDTRSAADYAGRHIEGAINLPFSEFTSKELKEVIGSTDKRILIYCNNNFRNDPQFMLGKLPPLALNIPTFINLFGYGYENVYELKESIDVNDPRIEFRWVLADRRSFGF